MKFLHTSDWQIGMKARHAGDRAPALRRQRLETARKIMQLAKDESVEFVLLAGDTFEDQDVETSVIEEVHGILSSAAPIPVYVLPGNHDPLSIGSVWDRNIWSRPGNVVVLRNREALELSSGGSLVVCPLAQKRSLEDPTAWIPKREPEDRRIRIALAHGSLPVPGGGSVNFPILPNRAELAGLDYLALGDWHGLRVQGRTAYPGTPEQTSFTDKESGHVLIVEIPTTGSVPTITPHRVGCFHWLELDQTARDITDVEALRKTIESLGKPEEVCLGVSVTIPPGADPCVAEALQSLRNEIDQIFWLNWTVRGSMTESGAASNIPDGILREIYESLLAEGAAMDHEIVIEARRWMLEIASEVGQ